jgi:hypothetical protein
MNLNQQQVISMLCVAVEAEVNGLVVSQVFALGSSGALGGLTISTEVKSVIVGGRDGSLDNREDGNREFDFLVFSFDFQGRTDAKQEI